MMLSISYYINPNTRALTSNYKNTVIKDKEAYNGAMSQHLLNPVEDLAQALKTPIKLAKGASLQIPLHRITDSASNGSVFPVVTEHFSASSDHAFL